MRPPVAKRPRIDYAALVECVRAETYCDPIGEGQAWMAAAGEFMACWRYTQAHPGTTEFQVRCALGRAVRDGLLVGGPDSGYLTKEAFR